MILKLSYLNKKWLAFEGFLSGYVLSRLLETADELKKKSNFLKIWESGGIQIVQPSASTLQNSIQRLQRL